MVTYCTVIHFSNYLREGMDEGFVWFGFKRFGGGSGGGPGTSIEARGPFSTVDCLRAALISLECADFILAVAWLAWSPLLCWLCAFALLLSSSLECWFVHIPNLFRNLLRRWNSRAPQGSLSSIGWVVELWENTPAKRDMQNQHGFKARHVSSTKIRFTRCACGK